MKKLIAFACLIIVLFVTFSCKKNGSSSNPGNDKTTDNPGGDKTPEVVAKQLTAEKSAYAAAELVGVTIDSSIVITGATQQQITGKFNNATDVKIVIQNNTACFLMPAVNDGQYPVTFSIGDKKFTVQVNITNITNVLPADSYASSLRDSISAQISSLQYQAQSADLTADEKAAASADAGKYTANLQDFNQQYQALTPTQKADFAQYMAANISLLNDLRTANQAMSASFTQFLTTSATTKPSLRTNTLPTISDLEARQKAAMEAWIASAQVFDLNDARLQRVLLISSVGTGASILGNAAVDAANNYLETEVMGTVRDNIASLNKLMDNAVVAYNNLSLSQITASQTTDTYTNGQTKVATVSASYRNLTPADETSASSGAETKAFLSRYERFTKRINNLLDKTPARFRPSTIIKAISNSIATKTKSVNNKYCAIGSSSNPKVTLTSVKQADGTYSLKASTTEQTDQTFSYDVTYSDPDYSTTGLKSTFSGIIKAPVDSIPIYTAAAMGNWRCTWYGSNLGSVDDYVLGKYEAGQRTYTATASGGYAIPDGDPYNTVTWYVYKGGDAYYITITSNNRTIGFGGKLSNYPNLTFKSFPVLGSTTDYTIFQKK